VDGDGWGECTGDCDETDPAIHPGAEEVCNGVDDDCDGVIPADELDSDGDGHSVCSGADCDDDDPEVYLGRPELCDGADNNCNGEVDEGLDVDGDGFTPCEGDCDEAEPDINPSVPEYCDGIDNDCDVDVDEGFDNDADGWTACAGDCEDYVASVNPDQPEICDAWDTDCDGVLPADEADADGDGVALCAADCDDEDALRTPGAPELCDGIDNDCDLSVPVDEVDDDSDGFMVCAGDCDDDDAGLWPGATEQCDGLDNDCDGVVPLDEVDQDGDGWRICDGDCGDLNPDAYPGAPEVIDGADNNCDGFFDNYPPVAIAVSDADAGPVYICSDITLDGSGSWSPDPDGAIVGWEWTVQGRPAGSLVTAADIGDVNAELTAIVTDVLGWYALDLTVTDDIGATATDTVVFEAEYPPGNVEPVADAGNNLLLADESVCYTDPYGGYICPNCPDLTVALDGSASSDADGDTLSYTWTLISGAGSITDPAAETTSATLTGATTTYGVTTTHVYSLLLTVEDCPANTDTAVMTVTYECAGVL